MNQHCVIFTPLVGTKSESASQPESEQDRSKGGHNSSGSSSGGGTGRKQSTNTASTNGSSDSGTVTHTKKLSAKKKRKHEDAAKPSANVAVVNSARDSSSVGMAAPSTKSPSNGVSTKHESKLSKKLRKGKKILSLNEWLAAGGEVKKKSKGQDFGEKKRPKKRRTDEVTAVNLPS